MHVFEHCRNGQKIGDPCITRFFEQSDVNGSKKKVDIVRFLARKVYQISHVKVDCY